MMVNEGNKSDVARRNVANAEWETFAAKLGTAISRQVQIKYRRFLRRIAGSGSMKVWLRDSSIQLALYSAIVVGALGMTYVGSELLIQMMANKMIAMGQDVVRQNVPATVETASFRPAQD